MPIDLLGPASAPNITLTRPTDARIFPGADTWFKDCTNDALKDGTRLQADFLNGVLAQVRTLIRSAGVTENNADDAMVYKAVLAIAGLSTGVPIGGILIWPGTSLPSGFLKLNGAAISRTTYAALYALAAASGRMVTEANWSNPATLTTAAFSDGDGSTSFRLPDWRGEFMRGFDDGRGIDVSRVLTVLQKATSLGVMTGGGAGADATNASSPVGAGYTNSMKNGDGLDGTNTGNLPSYAGGGTLNMNTVRPRNVAAHYIIRAL